MARYVISVGGTGQHIALALTRLARLGAVSDLRLIALDSDTETPLPKTLTAPTPSMTGTTHPLKDGSVHPPFDLAKLGKKKFEEIFVDADHKEESELFECLFDADEGSIPVHKGMYGTPCVGATVFAEGACGNVLKDILSPLNAATQVFICGSVVGGTGAGLIHKLVDEVRKTYKGDIFGIFMLPWFDVPGGGGSGAITPAIIERNKTHGVKYFYEHTIPQLSASLLLGYPGNVQTKVLRRIAVVDGDMGEHPSYLHLAAAYGLLALPEAFTANRGVKAYGVSHSRNAEGWLLDQRWEGGRELRSLVQAARVQHNLLEFLASNRVKIVKEYDKGFFSTASFDEWLPLHRSIQNSLLPKADKSQFVEAVMDRFGEIKEEVGFCVKWAQAIFPGDVLDAKLDTRWTNLSQASGKGADSSEHWKQLQGMWSGRELGRDMTRPRTGRDVADYHAKLILDEALTP